MPVLIFQPSWLASQTEQFGVNQFQLGESMFGAPLPSFWRNTLATWEITLWVQVAAEAWMSWDSESGLCTHAFDSERLFCGATGKQACAIGFDARANRELNYYALLLFISLALNHNPICACSS
jgi:hypothetical protein